MFKYNTNIVINVFNKLIISFDNLVRLPQYSCKDKGKDKLVPLIIIELLWRLISSFLCVVFLKKLNILLPFLSFFQINLDHLV